MPSNGNAELSGGLLIFAECRKHHCFTLQGALDYTESGADEISLRMSLGIVLPSVVSVVCACTMSSVASSQDRGCGKILWEIILTALQFVFQKAKLLLSVLVQQQPQWRQSVPLTYTSLGKVALTKIKYEL